MVTYSLIEYKDVYTLSNQGVAFSYNVYRKDCTENVYLYGGTLASGSVILPFTEDSKYLLVMIASDDDTETNVVISKYNNLLISIIKSTEQELCDCKCKNCDCDEPKETECLNTKLAVYNHLTGEGTNTITSITPYFDCRFNEGVTCNYRERFFYGKENCSSLTLDNIILQYLGIYYAILDAATDEEEEEYVKLKFKSDRILPCISRKGIDLQAIQTLL